jgi:tRNA-splicing ligase RtcB
MPDVHMGKGSVVGFTMTFNSFINPHVIGVDIGCGVAAYKIGQKTVDLEEFDQFIHRTIPSGSSVHKTLKKKIVKENHTLGTLIGKVAPQEHKRILFSIGTLGGGNHFIELDRDEEDNIWLVIHSGSRNLGLQVCHYHQRKAKEAVKKEFSGAGAYHGMEYMRLDEGGEEYLHDMQIAQEYAEQNRNAMAQLILEEFFTLCFSQCEVISSIHNYCNFDDNIIRKGAIAAHRDQKVIIPLNMRDGCLIATGKGNRAWNSSAPHGAGRLLRRSETRSMISLQEYRETMQGIFSSCITEKTIDESPQAYKDADEIIGAIEETVTPEYTMKPIYNFKA